jgi:cysteine synthase
MNMPWSSTMSNSMSAESVVARNVLDLIGNTPVVDVSNLSPNPRVRLVAKLESQNPFGSVKDRIAKAMIDDAEKSGRSNDVRCSKCSAPK